MTPNHHSNHNVTLTEAVRQAIAASGFEAELAPDARAQLQQIIKSGEPSWPPNVRDLRAQLWSSIDNEDTRDLDQIELAERLPGNEILLRIGVADVDALVPKGSPLDKHAQQNATSLYAGRAVLPMLPAELSENLTSLVEDNDRLAIVAETV